MAAIRIIDDHLELASIGTNSHAQIDAHIADPSAHHTKYTDAEAVSAVATADDYVKNTGDIVQANNPVLEIISDAAYPQADSPQGFSFHKNWGTDVWYSRNYFGMTTNSANWPTGVGGGMKIWIGNTTQDCLLDFFNYRGIGGANTYDFVFVTRDLTNAVFLTRLQLTGNVDQAKVQIKNADLDLQDNTIMDITNHADATLSGTPKLTELDIGGTPYYFKVYPTKT